MKKQLLIAIITDLVIIALAFVLGTWIGRKQAEKTLGGATSFGRIGVFNLTPLTLSNGDGAALAIDSAGHLYFSSSTQITIQSP